MTNFILLSIFAYLLGSIPFGFIIPKIKGIDIKVPFPVIKYLEKEYHKTWEELKNEL